MSTLWPFIEAQKIIDSGRLDKTGPIIFETGYGPSGLPHIGTFGEVARTTWVRKAFESLTGRETKLICFSDDMDALRKVPDNIPNQELLNNSLGLPLSKVPNPFDTEHASFSDHNNSKLNSFLDNFNFDYEFASSSDYYKSGRFNYALKRLAIKHEEVCLIVRKTLRGDKVDTWSPFMPIHPITGIIMTVPVLVNPEEGTLTWKDEDGIEYITSIYDGNAKIGWKVDWALRWYALGVDYEMSGKDLIESVKLSSKICRVLGGVPPINLTYELFLDSVGEKISKSKGNGFTIEDWLSIGDKESLSLFMFNNPTRAKRVHHELVPQVTDEYIKHNNNLYKEDVDNKNNPLSFFINPQSEEIKITYQLLINLTSASNATTKDEIYSYLEKYNIDHNNDYIENLIEVSINYYNLYIKANKVFRSPTEIERSALNDLIQAFRGIKSEEISSEILQYWTYEIGKKYDFNLRDWFKSLYEILLGQTSGPRFGVFSYLYGVDNIINLIESKLENE